MGYTGFTTCICGLRHSIIKHHYSNCYTENHLRHYSAQAVSTPHPAGISCLVLSTQSWGSLAQLQAPVQRCPHFPKLSTPGRHHFTIIPLFFLKQEPCGVWAALPLPLLSSRETPSQLLPSSHTTWEAPRHQRTVKTVSYCELTAKHHHLSQRNSLL